MLEVLRKRQGWGGGTIIPASPVLIRSLLDKVCTVLHRDLSLEDEASHSRKAKPRGVWEMSWAHICP